MDSTHQMQWVKKVSRSFALSLLWLPKPQRNAVGLTYCLARYADTLTDSGSWSQDERLAHLESWENAIFAKDSARWQLKGSLGKFSSEDAAFLADGAEFLRAFFAEEERYQEYGREVLKTLMQGMKFDLKSFSGTSPDKPIYGCKDEATFDYYCHLIAGCVGRYWVQMFELPEDLELFAVAYGKALQRINVIRDVVEDWNRGRVYLPKTQLHVFRLDTKEPWRGADWRRFTEKYFDETKRLLISARNFCQAIPNAQKRVRFASMMPLMIGLETIHAMQSAPSWEKRIKISRSQVRSLAFRALLNLFLRSGLNRWSRRYME
jgi:farnesyl-diphosphate farnesyltransferase